MFLAPLSSTEDGIGARTDESARATLHWRTALALTLALLSSTPSAAQTPGAIVAVGGGGTTDRIAARTLELAGGREAIVVVLPQASAQEDAGDASVQLWRDAGAKSARTIGFSDPNARAALRSASLIWISGGDQNRFMSAIEGTGLDAIIRERHRAGAVVGGTSAGAAVLSELMITGDADLQSLTAGATTLAKGLGIWTAGIFDQHFLRRQRTNRLLSAVLDHPQLIGVGIDEATAAIVHRNRLEVVGRSAVVVFDARRQRGTRPAPGDVSTGTVTAIVLRDGMSLPLR